MRILLTTGIFRPELGGPATYTAELAKRLKTAGHTVAVITYSNKGVFSLDAEYQFPIMRIIRGNKIWNYIRYFFAVLAYAPHYDFIYSLDWFSAGIPVMWAAKFRGKKYIVRVGGGYIWEKYLAQGKPPMSLKAFYEKKLYRRYPLMYLLIKKVLRNASEIIFNSDDQRELYQKHYKLNPEKLHTIFNPVPEHRFGTLLKTHHRPQARDKEIVFAGRFIKMKNVESLVRAFAELKDHSFTLLLIGEGPLEEILRKLVIELKLRERVTFMAPLSQADLYRRIANCYYVVIPSWTDVSPNQAYECLAIGIPFLISKENYLSISEQLPVKIDPGSVADIAEKMNSLSDFKNYVQFVEQQRAITFHHTWNEVLRDHMRIFKQVS